MNSRNTDERSNALVVHASDVLQPLSLEFTVLAFRTIKFVHSSLPFEHLGQSSLCENQVFFYFRTETIKAHFYFKILGITYTMHIKNTHLK